MKKGYTLIELMIALAISALLVGLAVPRFTTYQQQLEFEQEARVIQECMQSAADQVAAPVGLAVGTSKLTVTLASTGGSVTCSYKSDASGAIPTPTVTAKIALCTITNTPTSVTVADTTTYVLPLVSHGRIQSLTIGSTAKPISSATVFTFKPINCPMSGMYIYADITVPSSGLPVKLNIVTNES